ncbi:MAG: hypothetical protein GC145_00065 [Caulobacter sp.]|nr:hypothetical protein [Caulobacter sp.]
MRRAIFALCPALFVFLAATPGWSEDRLCQAAAFDGQSAMTAHFRQGETAPYWLVWASDAGSSRVSISFRIDAGDRTAIDEVGLSITRMLSSLRRTRDGEFELRFRGQSWRKPWRADPRLRRYGEESFRVRPGAEPSAATTAPDGFTISDRGGRVVYQQAFAAPPDAAFEALAVRVLAKGREMALTGEGCMSDAEVEDALSDLQNR